MMSDLSSEQSANKEAKKRQLSLAERGLTEIDLTHAAKIPASGCPRRYCWWWISALFEWNLSPNEGCTLLQAKKPPGYKYGDVPCCRSEPSSSFDHFEPREPFIEADGIDASRWLQYRAEKDAGA